LPRRCGLRLLLRRREQLRRRRAYVVDQVLLPAELNDAETLVTLPGPVLKRPLEALRPRELVFLDRGRCPSLRERRRELLPHPELWRRRDARGRRRPASSERHQLRPPVVPPDRPRVNRDAGQPVITRESWISLHARAHLIRRDAAHDARELLLPLPACLL